MDKNSQNILNDALKNVEALQKLQFQNLNKAQEQLNTIPAGAAKDYLQQTLNDIKSGSPLDVTEFMNKVKVFADAN